MEGLDKFRDAFANFSDNYIIIGGTACNIAMTGTTMRPRTTHDIDIIVIVENMTPEFAKCFWNFVKEAGYRPEKCKHTDNEKPKYELYRSLYGKKGYPEMIELLARRVDFLLEPTDLTIEPLPIDENTSSLSAIVMDDDFYHFTIAHSQLTDGIRHATPAALIALKAKAYLNLLHDKKSGKHVNSKDIKKHRSDVLKNVAIIEESSIIAPAAIITCVNDFVYSIRQDWNTLSQSLSKSLGQSTEFVSALLDQLNELFVTK